MYPIEKYTWLYAGTDEEIECVRFVKSVFKLSIFKNGDIYIGLSHLSFCDFGFKELQAIYETAEQIRRRCQNESNNM